MWQPSESDPNLEAAFLARFMQYLGVDGQQAEQALTQSVAARSNASELARVDNGTLLLAGDYGRNWRRTALALDRIGLTVMVKMPNAAPSWFNKAPTKAKQLPIKTGPVQTRIWQRQSRSAKKQYPETQSLYVRAYQQWRTTSIC